MFKMFQKLNPQRWIYNKLLDDLVEVMTTIHNHRFSKKYKSLKEKIYG